MARVPLYKKVEEIVEVLDELSAEELVTAQDSDFIMDQMGRVNKDEHLTTFSDKQAEHVNRIYEIACKSPY